MAIEQSLRQIHWASLMLENKTQVFFFFKSVVGRDKRDFDRKNGWREWIGMLEQVTEERELGKAWFHPCKAQGILVQSAEHLIAPAEESWRKSMPGINKVLGLVSRVHGPMMSSKH